MQELLHVKDEVLQHGGERKGNYLLVRAIKRVMKALPNSRVNQAVV